MFERWEEEMEAEEERKNSQKIREVESWRSQQRREFVKGENESAGCCNEVRGGTPGSREENIKSV